MDLDLAFGAGEAAGKILVPLWLFVTLLFSAALGLAHVQHVLLFAGKVVVPGRLFLSSAPFILLLVLVECCGFCLEFLRGVDVFLVVSFSDDPRNSLQPLVPIHPE